MTQIVSRAPAREPARPRLRPGVVDPVVVGVVAFVVYALHGFDGLLSRDLGIFVYGGERVAHGVPPYQDVFNSVGPLADAIPGAAIWAGKLVGADPVYSARVLYLLLASLCCALICVLARDTFDSRAAGVLAAVLFLPFQDFLDLAASGPREKTAMLAFLLAALILVGRQRWLAAGALAALATLTWQPALLAALAAAVVGALVTGGRRVETLARLVAGGLAVLAAGVGYFALVGGLHTAFDGFVVVNLFYTHQPSAISQPTLIWNTLWSSYHVTLLLALIGLACLLVLAGLALRDALPSAPTPSTGARRLVTVGAGAAAAACWTILVINGGPDLYVVLPFSALGLARAVLLLADRLPTAVGGVRLVAGVVCAAVLGATVVSVSTRDSSLVAERADVEAVLGTQPPSATVLSIDVPQVLALSQRTDPIPYQLFDGRMRHYLDHEIPGGLVTLREQLVAAPPTFVVVGFKKTGRWADPLLREDYWFVGRTASWAWYLNRSAGVDALLRAREANATAMAGR